MKTIHVVTRREDNDYIKNIIIDGTLEEIKELYEGQTIKVDGLTEILKVTKEELSTIISININKGFPYGLLIDNYFILCEEITLYSLIDYEKKYLNLINLKRYFQEKKKNFKINIEDISVFDTESILLGEKDTLLDYCNGFHVQNRLKPKTIKEVINKASTKLLNMSYSTGKFIYGIDALTGEKYTSYNLLRHAGSIWSIINAKKYIKDPDLEQRVEKIIDYILDRYMVRRRNKIFISKSERKDACSIGASGLMLLALTDYQVQFKNDKYLEIAKGIADGILSMQQPNGQYYQIYDNNLELKEPFECEFYVGETTLALMKIYAITKEEKYLDSVMDALDYCISIGFEKYSDHWMAYTLAALSEYVQNEKIIEFATRNVNAVQRTRFNPTRLEASVQLYKFYENMKKYDQFASNLEEFPIEQVESNINFYLKMLMSYYIDDETAIYMKNINISKYGFFCPSDNNRMRIDDIQHSIMGLMNYIEICNKE